MDIHNAKSRLHQELLWNESAVRNHHIDVSSHCCDLGDSEIIQTLGIDNANAEFVTYSRDRCRSD